MYKVFIVEDEHLIRESLRKLLLSHSENYPISFAGEAADGELGLAAMLDVKPDILITDIRMPFMDGLTLAKEAKKILPWIKIILISGYDDFDYAKSAIQLGVEEYLLKPIKEMELQDTLTNVIAKLDTQKELTAPSAAQPNTFIFELQKNHFLNGLYKGELAVEDVISESQQFNRHLLGNKFTVLLATNKYDADFADYNRFSEYLTLLFGDDPAIIFSSISSEYIKFLVFQPDKQRLLEKCYQIANTLIHELEQDDTYDIVVAFGNVVERISEIKNAFQITEHLIQTYGNLRTEKIISYEDDILDGEVSPTNPFKLDIADKIARLDPTKIDELVHELSGTPHDKEERNRLYRFFVLIELVNLVQKKEIETAELSLEQLSNIEYLAAVANTLEQFQLVATPLITYLSNHKINAKMVKYQSVIQKALTFINQHFTDPDISLNTVADEVTLSPAHFSTIFSQAMEITFIDYLTNARLNHAKKLLKETDDRLGTIAFAIGYNDPNYFSYLFKKKIAISPKEYRNQVNQ